MAINAGTISAFLELNTSNFSAGIASANSQLQALSDDNLNAAEKIKGVGGALTTIGGTLTKNWTVPLVGAGAAAVTVAANFDAGMSKVQAISGATGEELDKLRDKAREMGAKTKFSASEAADAMSYMAMAGWKTGDMLDGIEGIMNLAAASGEDLAATSDIVTDALTAFGLSAKDSAHFSDILAAASSNANTNVSMMGESFKYCAPIAGAMGYSAEDTAEALGLMANSGIKASQSGTAMRSIMTKLTGEIKLSGKELGNVTIQTTNADGSMRGLSEILGDCRSAFSKLTDSEKSQAAETLAGKYAMSGFLSLMNAAPEDIGKLSGAISNCDGTAKRMADTMQDNLQGQLTVLKSQTEEVAIAFGTELMPVAQDLVGKASEAVQWFGSLDSGAKRLIVNAGLVAASLGPVLMITGKLTSGVGALMKTVGGAVTAFQGASSVMGGLGAALTSIVTPAGWVVLGLAAVTAAGVALYAAHRNATKGTRELGEAMKGAAKYAEEFNGKLDISGGTVEFTAELSGITSKIQDTQDKIDAIIAESEKKNRKLTDSEIKRLKEYYEELKKLHEEQAQYYTESLGALTQSVNDGLEVTTESAGEILAQGKATMDAALDAEKQAHYQRLHDIQEIYKNDAAAREAAIAKENADYKARTESIKTSFGELTAAVADAYAKQNLTESEFFAKLKEHNDAVEAENQRHSKKMNEITAFEKEHYTRLLDERRMENAKHNRVMSQINQQLVDNFDTSSQEIIGTLTAMIADIQANNGVMTAETRALAEEILTCYNSLPEDMREPFNETVTIIQQAMDDSKAAVAEAGPQLVTESQKIFSSMAAEFNKLPGSATKASQNAVDGMISPFESKENKGKIKTATKGFVKLIPDAAKDELDENSPSKVMDKIGGFAIDGLIQGIGSKKGSAVSSIGGIMQNMLTAARGVDFKPVGSNIVGGILSGLNARKNSLLATAGNLANSISTKIKSALKINSPSRVMMEIGEFTTAGMELGLMKGSQSLYETASAISRDTAEALSGITPTVHTDFSGSFAEDKLDRLLEAVERLADSRPTMEIDGRPFGRLVREYV